MAGNKELYERTDVGFDVVKVLFQLGEILKGHGRCFGQSCHGLLWCNN